MLFGNISDISDVSWTLDVMKRNEHKDKELEFQHNMIRFVKLGDACHTFRGKHVIGGIVFYKHTYSRTSVARTPMARLPWTSQTRSWVRRDFLQVRYTDNLGRFSSIILQMYAVCTR